MILPVPWQCGQVCWMLKKPWRMCTAPAPLQVGQVLALRARLGAACRWQVSQSSQRRDADLRFLAVRRFLERDLHRVAQVAAAVDLLAAGRRAPPAAPPPKMSPKMSPNASAKPPKPSAPGPPPAAHVRVDAGMAVLVVGRALLRRPTASRRLPWPP